MSNLENSTKKKINYKGIISIFLSIYLILVFIGIIFYNSYPSIYEIVLFIAVLGYLSLSLAKQRKE